MGMRPPGTDTACVTYISNDQLVGKIHIHALECLLQSVEFANAVKYSTVL